VKRVDVVAPGFTADCLETLEELAMEGRRQLFSRRAARNFTNIPALNEHPRWIDALGRSPGKPRWLGKRQLDRDTAQADLAASKQRALQAGRSQLKAPPPPAKKYSADTPQTQAI